MIKIFKKDETNFSHDGLEVLDDIVISSYTEWSEESKWIIQAKFKKDFDKSESIKEGLIIQVPTEKGDQLFRILKINKKNRKYISISGHAIGYDFNDNFIQDINIVEKSGRVAMQQISNGTVYPHRYNLTSNIDRVASARVVRRNGMEALINTDKDNTFVERWGGCLVLDNFNISMNEAVGQDRGVEISIGKNIIGYDGDIDEETVCTGINAITYDGLTLPEGVYYSPLVNNYPHPKIREFKFDNIKYKYSENNYDKEGYETLDEVYDAIRKACDDLFNTQNIDKPTCSLRVNIAALENTDQYKGDELNERIFQGDILTANLEDYGFNVKLKMVANRYDNIRNRYIDIDLGDAKNNLFKDIGKIEVVIDKVVEQLGGNTWQDILDKSMQEAADLIAAGIKDSYVVARKNEILIMDSAQVESAINVIRMNKNGIAFSQNGYNGPYTLAITIDGKINASCIVTGELNAALIKVGVITGKNGKLAISVEDDYIHMTHTNSYTSTRIDAEGFYIVDSNGETIASLASKEAWTELKADKVFANNIENIYLGDSNLYVDHNSDNIIRNGTIDYPFTSFYQLKEHLENNPIINKNVFISVITEGAIDEQLYLNGLKGKGTLNFRFNNKFILKSAIDYGIVMINISTRLELYGNRTSWNSADGFIIKTTNGINLINCNNFLIDSLLTDSTGYGIYCERSFGKLANIDFCKAYSALGVKGGQVWLAGNCRGSNTKAVRVFEGAFVTTGETDFNSIRQQGVLDAVSGIVSEISTVTPTASTVYAPVIPPTVDSFQDFTATFFATYNYAWSNWTTGECKQGTYENYGNKAGHAFFDISAIRSFIGNGAIRSGTITITRKNAGGSSGATNIYINGSSATGASGTPSYSYNTLLGSLKWGETKTFTLPVSIINALKNGTANSLAFYSSSDSYAYAEPISVKINIKVNK